MIFVIFTFDEEPLASNSVSHNIIFAFIAMLSPLDFHPGIFPTFRGLCSSLYFLVLLYPLPHFWSAYVLYLAGGSCDPSDKVEMQLYGNPLVFLIFV